ncbi:DUF3265 domain-containing protein [Vibrio vulnificus]|nr:DUF3265 domain-containing protein [Vibrio vulnificus]
MVLTLARQTTWTKFFGKHQLAQLTKRLRGIWHAWHFRFALGSVIKSLCGSFCSACLHPLTQRYA